MDAQRRKLLKVRYEAFENAVVPLETIQGSDTSVYVGNFTKAHLELRKAHKTHSPAKHANGLGFKPYLRAHRWAMGLMRSRLRVNGPLDGSQTVQICREFRG